MSVSMMLCSSVDDITDPTHLFYILLSSLFMRMNLTYYAYPCFSEDVLCFLHRFWFCYEDVPGFLCSCIVLGILGQSNWLEISGSLMLLIPSWITYFSTIFLSLRFDNLGIVFSLKLCLWVQSFPGRAPYPRKGRVSPLRFNC